MVVVFVEFVIASVVVFVQDFDLLTGVLAPIGEDVHVLLIAFDERTQVLASQVVAPLQHVDDFGGVAGIVLVVLNCHQPVCNHLEVFLLNEHKFLIHVIVAVGVESCTDEHCARLEIQYLGQNYFAQDLPEHAALTSVLEWNIEHVLT